MMAESKKGHNFAKRKKIWVHLFFGLMLQIKFQVPSSSSSIDIVGTLFSQKGV